MEKQEWINQILEIPNSIEKIEPNEELYFRIIANRNSNQISLVALLTVAASLALLLSINYFVLNNLNESHSSDSAHLSNDNQIY